MTREAPPSMPAVLQRLKSLVAAARRRPLPVVVVGAVAAALGVLLAGRDAVPPIPEPAAEYAAFSLDTGSAEPLEASAARPVLDVDAFTELARRLAQERERRAQQMLDRVYPGLAFVTVGVELDPRWERTSERVQPEWPAVVEDERPAAGSAGARRRVMEPFAGTREAGLLAPEVRRVSVALVLDTSIAGNRVRRDAIVAAVANAVGPVQGRDPDVEVLVDGFRNPPPKRPVPVVAAGGAGVAIGLPMWAAVVALGALGLAWWRVRRGRRAVVPARLPAARDDDEPSLGAQVERAIERDPEAVTRLVEGWLAEART